MKASLTLDLNLDQIIALVRQLPLKEKKMLSRALEQDGIQNKLDSILSRLDRPELDEDLIAQEVEEVRKARYAARKD